ncbi:EndoU domain-containing protein [Paenibacillus pabuli]|uniref:EndoU domain-containing protein n=1 Tax=Paenibacillus pabuli TaxID=1472 RepID=UPI001FFE8ECA|nr:EndoU domain-containing protein [Paenibacillus pabuli]UPK44902.1 EndoU domain-containing protein [Paenibacillus pabuli]
MNPPFDSNQTLHLLKFRYNDYNQVGGEDRMQRIQVHPDVLDEKALLVQQKKQELERMVWELEKSIYMLQSDWSGVTGERFFWDFMQAKEVFPNTLGLLDDIQKEFTFVAKNFRTVDGSGEVALYIPEELKRNFSVGLLDKSVGETLTGMGQTAEALFYDPFGTVASVAYGLTLGKVVDVGRGIKFAWDAAWGNGTARSDIEQFVDEQKKQIGESGAGYYGGSVMGQVLAYAFVGKALRSKDDIGSGGGGKKKSDKSKEGTGQDGKPVVDKERWLGSLQNTENFKTGTKENGLSHIFGGEILKNGNANGFHYEGMPNSNGKIVGKVDTPNEFGVYQANVEINGVPKGPKSTFFPKEWTPQQVIDSVNEAFNNKVNIKNNKYIGKTSTGMEIELILRNDKIISAYPIY